MSVVTTLLLHVDGLEDWERESSGRGFDIAAVNAWLREQSAGFELRRLDEAPEEHWGGTKVPQVTLWAGAFNHFGSYQEAFLALLAGLSWAYPENVQLLVTHEDDDRMHVLVLTGDGGWHELIDGGNGDCWWNFEDDRLVVRSQPARGEEGS